jgi:hypothetical protein
MELALIVTTVLSVVVAAALGIVAWRMARAERLRSAARVAALAAGLRDIESIHGQMAVGGRAEPSRIHQVARRSVDFDKLELRSGRVPAQAGEMFRAGAPDRSGSRLAAVLAVGSFAVATSLALVVATGRGGPSIAERAAVQTRMPPQSADAVPLELVALDHARRGDRITIRGAVRNPPEGANVEQLAAVVYLFDRDGGFVGDGRAPIDVPTLAPGARSSFVVTVAKAANVGRYRVSFRAGERIVPHVDRRNPGLPGGTDR